MRTETIATGLALPWGVVPLPDGRVLVVERNGAIREVKEGAVTAGAYGSPPGLYVESGAGILDIVRDPADGTLLVSHAVGASGAISLAVSRARDTGSGLVDWTRVLTLPPRPSFDHLGGRMLIHDGALYLTTGERREPASAREDASPNGKILRVDRATGAFTIVSKGHRNPLGIAVAPDGTLWSTENGPSGFDAPGGGDEINRIETGVDYGWPTIYKAMSAPGLRSPAWQSGETAIAPGGLAIPTTERWAGRLVVPTLRGRALKVFSVVGGVPTLVETVSLGGSRLRTAHALPDGSLLVTTSDSENGARTDRLLRVYP